MGVTHCDLKPENILLINDELEVVNGIHIPLCNNIKLIDFGGATFDNAVHSKIICTR
jgi:serine/threonine protein kinase